MSDFTLTQTRVTTQFELRIEDDAVAVTEQEGAVKRSYRVPYEHLAPGPVDVVIWSKPRLWAAVVLLGLSVIMMLLLLTGGDVESGAALFYAALAAVAALLFIRSRQAYIVLKGIPPLVLMKDRPSAEAVAEFLARVLERKRAYLAEHYLLGTHESATVDAIHKLEMLRQEGSISDREFAILKGDVMRRAQDARPPEASPN